MALAVSGNTQGKRPFTFEDMMKLERIGALETLPMASGYCSPPLM